MTQLFPAGAPDVLYLVDLSSYVLRAYHAIAPLSSPSGEPTHAVHGTVSMLDRLVRQCRPALLAIAMDSGRETFRKTIYSDYKANRPPAPDDLRRQFERCNEVVRAYRIAVFQQPGVEADDLIASAVRRATSAGLRVVIVGADKDLMQLVSPSVVLWDTMRDRVFGVAEVEERFGVRVDQLRDLLALMGDSSDNIPGVPSVGPKTAKDLLNEFGSLAGIYAGLETISRKKLKETLIEHQKLAFLSQQLVSLKEDCDIVFEMAALSRPPRDTAALRAIYTELGFQRQLATLEDDKETPTTARSAATRMAPGAPAAGAALDAAEPPGLNALVAPETQLTTLLSDEALAQLLTLVRETRFLTLESHTLRSPKGDSVVVGMALAARPGQAAYIPFAHRVLGAPRQLGARETLQALAPLLADATIKKGAHDLKREAVILADQGVTLRGGAFDARLAAYLDDPEASHQLEQLSQRLGLTLPSYETVTEKKRGHQLGFDEVPVENATTYAAARVDALQRLHTPLVARLSDEGLQQLYDDIEVPLATLLADLERTGILLDSAKLAELGAQCEAELRVLEKRAHEAAGRSFNVNSPRQLETLLFDELGLKSGKRTKTSRSTDAATLELLADEHPLVNIVLELRQLAKLKGTYLDALPKLVRPDTGRVHTRWEQAVAATGRLSSTDPNLQNIPIRSALGRKIREAFIAPPGHQLVSADYSQIELRVLAHLSEDAVLVDAFVREQDIHTRTAMEVFGVAEADVTREMRTRAKAVNFGVIYGQGDSALGKALGISRLEAGNFIATYFRKYAGVQRFMTETLDHARQGGAVRSLLGRRRILGDIQHGNRARRLAAERIAMNMPIQGTAADILKLAMLALAKPPTPGTRMLLSVHDELVFEVPDAEVAEAKERIRSAMEGVFQLRVPLVVDVGHGPNWNDAH